MTQGQTAPKEASPLARRLAVAIVDHLVETNAQPGMHLNASTLADNFSVSRFPIREALQLLAEQQIVAATAGKGFFLRKLPAEHPLPEALLTQVAEDDLYFRIFQDKLLGHIADEFTETDLMRRYGFNRTQVRDRLDRLAREGWIERRMGYGWAFTALAISPQSLAHSYRMRMAIEPAGLLEPSFKVDRDSFNYWRKLMRDLRERPDQFSNAQLYSIGSRFHEMLMECTQNPFFLDTLKRLNRLRQMMEYHLPASRHDTARVQADEHLELLDLLEDGDFMGASTLMRRHLDVIGRRKLKLFSSDAASKLS